MEIQQHENETMPSNKNKDYLQYFPRGKKSTKQSNASGFKKFCLWANKTPQKLIQEYENAKSFNNLDDWERDTANSIIKFYKWLQNQINPKNKKVYSSNYCNNVGSSILAFYHQNCKAIEGVMDSFNPTQMPKNEYRFSQDDLGKMYHFGDVEEKALISLAVSYGQGSKDFLKLEAQKLREVIAESRQKNKDFAMWIGDAREKTGISPVSFLTPEAIESVDAYLKLLEKKHGKLPKFVWCSNKTNKHLSNEGLNKKLRRIVAKANIETNKKNVHFHCVRKFTFSRLRRIDKDMAKIICGKSVSVSDMTYEEIEDQAEKVFKLAYRNLALNGNLMGKSKDKQEQQIKQLEQAMQKLEDENYVNRTRMELLQKTAHETKNENQNIKNANQKQEIKLQKLEHGNNKLKYVINEQQKLIEKMGKRLDEIYENVMKPLSTINMEVSPEQSKKGDLELIDIGTNPFTFEKIKTPEEAEQLRKKVEES